MTPFNANLINCHQQRFLWAYSISLASFLMDRNGPIHFKDMQGFACPYSWATMDPFTILCYISYRQQWAHSMALATFLMCSNWPIQSHRQLFPWKIMGPFIIISNILDQQWVHSLSLGVFLMGNNGWPILSYWQLFPWAIMGPFIVIGNISFNQ